MALSRTMIMAERMRADAKVKAAEEHMKKEQEQAKVKQEREDEVKRVAKNML